MSDDPLPGPLARLLGQHPAALRTISWSDGNVMSSVAACLAIETKHGFVTLIDGRTGAAYVSSPGSTAPLPDVDPSWRCQLQDLTETVPGAFAGRPRFSAIAPEFDADGQTAWRFEFDTGAAFTLTLGEPIPVVSGSS